MQYYLRFTLFILLGFSCMNVYGQERYLDPIFDNVQVSGITPAGNNYTVLNWIFAASQQMEGHTLSQPLVFQSYTPEGDTETNRPLVLFLHTGNFFPFPLNGSCGGTIGDSLNVEIATRLAKMGYVVASCNYRQGWLPTHPEEVVRRFSLINAAYRGMQDVRTFIRFFKKSVAENGNPYGIDPNKIVVWGLGTGGYLSLATAYLNSYSEILTTSDPDKFQLETPAGKLPMVIEKYNGNIFGTNEITTVDATYNAISSIPVGDTLSIPNHQNYDSDFQLAVNIGGALGDSTWINAGEVPLISFHSTEDAFAPYKTDVLLVATATGPQPVVEVSGSYDVQKIIKRLGNNEIFNTIPEGADPMGNVKNGEFNGLMSFDTPGDDGYPWEWTDLDNEDLVATDCNGDAEKSKLYVDTIIGYYAPRACVALGLNCNFTVSTEDNHLTDVDLRVVPNPVENYINIESSNEIIKGVDLISIQGKTVLQNNAINSRSVRLNRNDLVKGVYFLKTYFDRGVVTRKIVLR